MNDPLEKIRSICMALPGATERMSHGGPSWFVGSGRQFASYADHHHGVDWVAVWCKSTPGFQQVLVKARPDQFFVPPYVGVRGWVGIRVDVPLDWEEVAELLEEAYRLVAPKRLIAELDAR